jgi:hypothetical protein
VPRKAIGLRDARCARVGAVARPRSAAGRVAILVPVLFIADVQRGGDGGGEHRPERAARFAPDEVERKAERLA